MTERLYYRDPALLEFDATVVEVTPVDGRYHTRLDRSAFYPTSGGQLFDTGCLGETSVIEVIEDGDEVVHITEQPAGETGTLLHGRVDAARRHMHRQQHTAQHILSQIVIRQFGFETVSVHLGDDYGAIELDAPQIESSHLAELEREASRILFANWPVSIHFLSGEELEKIPLRKIPSRDGELRVIKIGEFDYSACGGTHCSTTAEVGLIKVVAWEKLRGHVLVKFLAGSQALEDYRMRFEVSDGLTRALTCHVTDLAGKIEKLTSENKDQRKLITQLHKELLPLKMEELAAVANVINGRRLVYKEMPGMDAQSAGQLAGLVADHIDGIVLLHAEGRLLLAVSAGTGLHASELAKTLGAKLGLKGGGSNKFAQLGGAEPSKLEEYKAALTALIGNA